MTNTTTKPTESFADLFAESLAKQEMKQGEVIPAEVVRVDYNYVVVNAGLKSESFIPIEEFKNDRGEVDVKVGDFVSVAIESLENGYGDTVLSRDKAKRLAAWMNLEKALETGELVTGTVTGKVKGGLTVMTNGIRAFLPGSLVDTRPVKDTTKARPWNSRSSSLTANATTSFFLVALLSKLPWAKKEPNSLKHSRKALSSRVLLRTSLTTVHSLTSAVSTVFCTSPTSHGAAFVIRAKSSNRVRKSPLRS